MFVAEVVETKTAYTDNPKDDRGDVLPLGSIEIRIGSHQSNLGQVRNVYARPATFNRRQPLIGEMVYIINSPTNDWSTSGTKGVGFLYFSPLNTTDDLVLHKFPKLWARKGLAGGGNAGERKSDKSEAGYTFPKSPKKIDPIQVYDGDDVMEGRFGHSIRFGSTISGGDMSVYSQKPTWKGSTNADPLMILRLKKPEGGSIADITSIAKFKGSNKYSIEDLSKDESSIYMTTTQMLSKLKGGFDKNLEVKKLGNYAKPQIVIDSERVVINAKKDILFLIGATQTVVTGKKVLFQSDKYKVDLDELMEFLKKWLGHFSDICSAKAQLATASGPTGISTNLSQVIQLQTTDFTKFKQP